MLSTLLLVAGMAVNSAIVSLAAPTGNTPAIVPSSSQSSSLPIISYQKRGKFDGNLNTNMHEKREETYGDVEEMDLDMYNKREESGNDVEEMDMDMYNRREESSDDVEEMDMDMYNKRDDLGDNVEELDMDMYNRA